MAKKNSVAIRLTPTQRRALVRMTGVEHTEIWFQTSPAPRGYAGVAVLASKTAPATGPRLNMPFKVPAAAGSGSRINPFKVALS